MLQVLRRSLHAERTAENEVAPARRNEPKEHAGRAAAVPDGCGPGAWVDPRRAPWPSPGPAVRPGAAADGCSASIHGGTERPRSRRVRHAPGSASATPEAPRSAWRAPRCGRDRGGRRGDLGPFRRLRGPTTLSPGARRRRPAAASARARPCRPRRALLPREQARAARQQRAGGTGARRDRALHQQARRPLRRAEGQKLRGDRTRGQVHELRQGGQHEQQRLRIGQVGYRALTHRGHGAVVPRAGAAPCARPPPLRAASTKRAPSQTK